ncbi:MAG TPA: glycosyl hydrolase [Chthonomonadaceae bacterium]|nr:glycosyl hydrolase [Chthonomonadaceae bacterium]
MLIGLLFTLAALTSACADPVAEGFRNVPSEARMRMFWRIFGPAWNRDEIAYQLAQLRQAGVGGVMTCFTYPVALDDPAHGILNRNFLSPEFLDTLGFAAEEAKRNDLQFGICGGTGWPYGGPTVSLHDAAQHIHQEVGKPFTEGTGWQLPKLREGERILAAFLNGKEVTASIRGDRLPLPAHPQDRLLYFVVGPTYMRVKRASLGAEGYVIDHFSQTATQRYLDSVVAPLLRAAPPDAPVRSVFCDSLEVYGANWTHDFPSAFRRRNGYDLLPHLPALFDDNSPEAPALRYDFWNCCAELTEQEFARTVHAWCKAHGVAFVLEAYGTPSMGFTGARYCDVPWGEQYEWRGFSFSRFAASGGHLAGKKVIGAEAWTWTGIPNRLADTLSDLKLCSDLHFLAGENELTGVDYPYSPRSAGAPGWTPYYGPVLNENNPQWLCFPDLVGYVNRCQWLLQQGQPVADVALYTPTEDAFASVNPDQMLLDFRLRDKLASGPLTEEFGLKKAFVHRSDLITTLLEQGYNFDGIDYFAVNQLAKVKGSELVAGDGRYHIVVLPNLTGMNLPALKTLLRFCQAGGTVIATRRLPDRVYRLYPEATQELRTIINQIFGPQNGGYTTHACGKGKAIFTPDERVGLAKALSEAAIGPDMRLLTPQPFVCHVHRRVGERDFYFVANVGEERATFSAGFRVGAKTATLWNPLNEWVTSLTARDAGDGTTHVQLDLPARGSVFVCFAPGQPQSFPVKSLTYSSHPIHSNWHVTFEGPDAPPPVDTRELTSWTTWPGAKFFSGRATYTTTFTLPTDLPPAVRLRLPQVHEVAKVFVNGHPAGSAWIPPYVVDLTPLVHSGENTLQITVANLMVNRVLGLPDPNLRSLRAVYGNRFPDPEEKKLMSAPAPSGLIGAPLLLIADNHE